MRYLEEDQDEASSAGVNLSFAICIQDEPGVLYHDQTNMPECIFLSALT